MTQNPRAVTLALLLCCAPALGQQLTRGPYLQSAAEDRITLVFRTAASARATVRYGTSPEALANEVAEEVAGTTHVFNLTGLSPATRYWYSVEAGGKVLAQGPEVSFKTYPPRGSPAPFRFIAFGDSGNGSAGQWAVAERMNALHARPDFGLILGDIIYENGEVENYDPYFFRPYQELLKRMVIWTTIGNHDVRTGGGQPYRDAFYLPSNNPEGTEMYHSWDYGNAHFVCLDTHVSSYAAGSAQLRWAAQDLAASDATWKFVYFHVPPYSGGTHLDSAAVKDNILPVLEAAGVDVVFSGHSHVYERTFLLKANTIVQNHAATYDQRVAPGSIYVVSGTAGKSGGLANSNHPLMAYQRGNTLGTSIVEVNGPVLRGYFLDSDNQAHDLFTLFKNADGQAPKLAGVRARSATEVEVTFDEPVGASANLPSNYTITPSVAIQGAALQSDGRTVLLDSAAHSGGRYTLEVSGISDTASPTPNTIAAGSSRGYELPLSLVPLSGSWRYRLGSNAPPTGWAGAGFDDSAWTPGTAPLGYGEAGLKTTVPSGTLALYARSSFQVSAAAPVAKVSLSVRYDDGVVAFLNGTEVLRRNVPANQTRTTPASSNHEATGFETFDLSPFLDRLVEGKNVLAVEVHNVSTFSSDLYLDARLQAEKPQTSPPYVGAVTPGDGDTGVALTSGLVAEVKDDYAGVEPGAITLWLNGEEVTASVGGTSNLRTVRFAPVGGFASGTTVTAKLGATNAAGVPMEPFSWSFRTAGDPIEEADAGTHLGAADGGLAGADGGGGGEGEGPDGGPGAVAASGCGCATGGAAPLFALGAGLLLWGRPRKRGQATFFKK